MENKLFGFSTDSIPSHPKIRDKKELLLKMVGSTVVEPETLMELFSGKFFFLEDNEIESLIDIVETNVLDTLLLFKTFEEPDDFRESIMYKSLVKKINELGELHSSDLSLSDYQEISKFYSIKLIDLLTDVNRIDFIMPKTIKEHLDNYVISQEDAKTKVSNLVYTHALRTGLLKKDIVSESLPNNILLLVGATATGKTLICQKATELLEVPYTSLDCSSLVSEGIVGTSFLDCFTNLLQSCNGNVEVAEKGIVFLDEFDKLAINAQSSYAIGTKHVQEQLLTCLQGSKVLIPTSHDRYNDKVLFNTANISFILAGSFASGLSNIIGKRLGSNVIGYGTKSIKKEMDENILSEVTMDDINAFGIMSELCSRISSMSVLTPLREEHLVNLIRISKNNSYHKYIEFFKQHNIEFSIEESVIVLIAKKISESKFGARELNRIISHLVQEYVFEAPMLKGSTITIGFEEAIIKLSNYK